MRRRASFALSLPERLVRALVATLSGGLKESAQLVLPRLVRRSKFYEVTAGNALRIAIELVGRVDSGKPGAAGATSAARLTIKKAAGNAVEFGSIAAFGFSPLWLLAGASDILSGSRVYLRALEDELAGAGILAEGAHFGSVDQLLGVLEGTSATTATLIDTPPIELRELRSSLGELRTQATSLPSLPELASLFEGLKRTASLEGSSLLEVSSGVGLAFLVSAKNISRDHLVAPYREDWKPLREEGFGAYAARVSIPYRDAVASHFDADRESWTEKGLGKLGM